MRIDSDKRPEEGAEDEEDVDGGEGVILEPKLQIRVGEVEDEVEEKRQGDLPRQCSRKRFIEHGPVGHRDNRVEERPHRAEDPGGRRPAGLHEHLI